MLFGKRKLSNPSQHELPALQILRQWRPESSERDRREKEKGILLDDYSELIPRSNTFVLWEISLPSNQISSNKCIWELVGKRGENHELSRWKRILSRGGDITIILITDLIIIQH